MPLSISREVFITCAVTGSGQTQDRSSHVPRSPAQIADSALEAARAGAAAVHIHVRDPETGAPSRDLALYREVTDRIRASDTDVVLNLTAGMGGDLVLGGTDQPLPPGQGTDMIGAADRLALAEKVADVVPVNVAKEDLADVIPRLKMKQGFDVGMEMSGNQAALDQMRAEGFVDETLNNYL